MVKSLNQLGYHELDEPARPSGAPDRIAVGAAGDDPAAVRAVMRLVERLGFDAVDAGPLANGAALEPDGSPFAVTYEARRAARAHLVREVIASRPMPRPLVWTLYALLVLIWSSTWVVVHLFSKTTGTR